MPHDPNTPHDDILEGLSGPSEVTPVNPTPSSLVPRAGPPWTLEQVQCALVTKPDPNDQVLHLVQAEQSTVAVGNRRLLELLDLLRGCSAMLSTQVLIKAYSEVNESTFQWMVAVLHHAEIDRTGSWADARAMLLSDKILTKADLLRIKALVDSRVRDAIRESEEEDKALRQQAIREQRAAWGNDPDTQWLTKIVFVELKGFDEPVWDTGPRGHDNAVVALTYEPLLSSARLNIRSMDIECPAVCEWAESHGWGEAFQASLTETTAHMYLGLRYPDIYRGNIRTMEKAFSAVSDNIRGNIDNPCVYDPILEWMRQFDESAPLTPEEDADLDSFLHHATCGQVPIDDYHNVMTRKWLCGLFRTVIGDRGLFLDRPELMRDPANACPPDFMLVITDDGSGGCGKDHFLRALFGHAPSAYSISENFEAKRSADEDLKRLRYWCCVDSEFKGGRANRQDTADLKHTITKTTIDYRKFYTQATTKLPVRSVICATENTAECIRTDNTTRRYFIINVQAVRDITLSDGTVMRTAFNMGWVDANFDRFARLAIRAVRNGETCKLGSETRALQTANIRQHFHQVSDDALDTFERLVRLVDDNGLQVLNNTAGQLDDMIQRVYGKSIGARFLGWRLKELVETGLLKKIKGSSNRTFFAPTERFNEAVAQYRDNRKRAQKDAQARYAQVLPAVPVNKGVFGIGTDRERWRI